MAVSQRMWKLEQERKRRERLKRQRQRRNCAILVLVLAIVAVVAVVLLNTDKKEKTEPQAPPSDVFVDSKAVSDPYTTTREISDIKASFFKDSAFAGNALAQTIGMYGILENADFYAGVNVDLENVYETTPSGSTTSISEQFKSKRFKKIFLAFGENELSKLKSSEFKKDYLKLVDKIRDYQPDAKIYLISIPPVTPEASDAERNGITMKKIMEFNRRIMSIAVDEELYYVDAVDALGDNKDFMPGGVSSDGVNLNKAAAIDLLYYISKEAYIPDAEDLADMDVDEEEEDEDESEETDEVKKPQKTQPPQPTATVNVFKDSVNGKKKGE